MNEEWRPLPDDPDYLISNYGEVKSLKGGKERLLKPTDFGGYLLVSVPFEGCMRRVGVHRLVMLVFVGRCPEGRQVHHLDHKKHNNRLDNLLYVTPKENAQAAIPFRRVAERERERRRQAEYSEFLARLKQAEQVGVITLELAERRLSNLCWRNIYNIQEVEGIPNTFTASFYQQPEYELIQHLADNDFYAYPEDLVSNDYRLIWCPD